MKSRHIPFFFLLIITLLQCNNNTTDFLPGDLHPTYNIPFDLRTLSPDNIFVNKDIDYLYFYDFYEEKFFSYNYKILDKRQERELPAGCIGACQFTLDSYKGAPEIYVSLGHKLGILDGVTLKIKDSIQVFEPVEMRTISGLSAIKNGLMFIESCKDKAVILDRGIKKIIAQPNYNKYCLGMDTYFDEENGTIGIIGVGVGPNIIPKDLIHDKYDLSGNLISHQVITDVEGISRDLIKTNDKIDYFVTGTKLFSKKNLAEIGILKASYTDLVISEDGINLYGLLKETQEIHVINFNTKTFERIIDLDYPGARLFLDEDLLIVVHFVK